MDTRAKKKDRFQDQIKSNFTGVGLTKEQDLIPTGHRKVLSNCTSISIRELIRREAQRHPEKHQETV